MQYFAGTREFQIKEPTAVTIGKFDGLHRGHQKLLREVMRYREKGYKPAVFTFETAPGTLIRGKLQTMITTNEEREENLREAGVEYLVEYPFNQEVAHMDPEQFVAEILVGKMGAKAMCPVRTAILATSGRAMLNCFGNWHRNMDMRCRSLKRRWTAIARSAAPISGKSWRREISARRMNCWDMSTGSADRWYTGSI